MAVLLFAVPPFFVVACGGDDERASGGDDDDDDDDDGGETGVTGDDGEVVAQSCVDLAACGELTDNYRVKAAECRARDSAENPASACCEATLEAARLFGVCPDE